MRIIIFIVTAMVLSGCGQSQEKTAGRPSAIPVLASQPAVKDVPVYVESLATLHPSVLLEVRPQVSGTVAAVLVKEGEWVPRGTPLLELDNALYKIKRQETVAKLEMDKAALSAAQRKLDRFRVLADKDLISKAEWDELETAAEKSAAVVEADLAALKAAELDLERCRLCSCIDGRVGRIDIHPGSLAISGQASPLLTVVQAHPLLVEFVLTEKDAELLSNDRSDFELISLQSQEMIGGGKITFMDNLYDCRTGLLLVRGSASNREGALRPGRTVRVRIPVSQIAAAKIIPQKAVKYNQEGPYLYVIGEADVVEMRKIVLGPVQGNDIIVAEGLLAHEQVITDGHMRIYPGAKVEVRE